MLSLVLPIQRRTLLHPPRIPLPSVVFPLLQLMRRRTVPMQMRLLLLLLLRRCAAISRCRRVRLLLRLRLPARVSTLERGRAVPRVRLLLLSLLSLTVAKRAHRGRQLLVVRVLRRGRGRRMVWMLMLLRGRRRRRAIHAHHARMHRAAHHRRIAGVHAHRHRVVLLVRVHAHPAAHAHAHSLHTHPHSWHAHAHAHAMHAMHPHAHPIRAHAHAHAHPGALHRGRARVVPVVPAHVRRDVELPPAARVRAFERWWDAASSIGVQKKIEKQKNVAKGEKNMTEATYVSHPYACSNVSSDCSGG